MSVPGRLDSSRKLRCHRSEALGMERPKRAQIDNQTHRYHWHGRNRRASKRHPSDGLAPA